jgi:ribose 5-phosphate isomerase B
MTIHLGTDHGGFELKEQIKSWLQSEGHEVVDHGAYKFDVNDDYPDFIIPAAQAVAADEASVGVIFGGSGQGEAMAANRVKGVRAALYYGPAVPIMAVDASGRESQDPYEILKLTREHNHSNVLSIGVRFVSFDEANHYLARSAI